MTPTPHGQVPEALIDLIDAYAETRHRCGGIYNSRTEAARNAVIEALSGVQALSAGPATPPAEQQAAPKAAPGDAIDEAMRERDDAEDFIDALLDEVLGHERPEWSNLYGRADALNDVQERMTALHKPAVDKAWGQFQSAKAAPQQEAQEPYSIDADPQGIRAVVAEAITGALAFGAQGANPPPEGHWLTPFWEMAREEAMRTRPASVSSDTPQHSPPKPKGGRRPEAKT